MIIPTYIKKNRYRLVGKEMAECKCISDQRRIFRKDVDLLGSDKLNEMVSVANASNDPIRLKFFIF